MVAARGGFLLLVAVVGAQLRVMAVEEVRRLPVVFLSFCRQYVAAAVVARPTVVVVAEAVAQNLWQLPPQNWDAACDHLPAAVAVGLLASVEGHSWQSFPVVVDPVAALLPVRKSMTTTVAGTAAGPPSMAVVVSPILASQAACQLQAPHLKTRSAAAT